MTTVAVIVFLATTLAASLLYERLITEQARETSRAIAVQTFNTMFEVMRKGWTREDLARFLDSARTSFQGTAHRVTIYRGPLVESLFGAIDQPPPDADVTAALAGPAEIVREDGGALRYVYPLVARDECLGCHVNATVGQTLGVISVEHDLRPITNEVRQGYVVLFIGFAAALVAVAAISAAVFARRIRKPIDAVRERIEQVEVVKDLSRLDLESVDLGFDEINDLFQHMGALVERMRAIAVDKDILEFEIKILGKFIITSDIVRDWKRYIRDLLIDIDEILPAYSLFTIFKVDDDAHELDIFWTGSPTPETRSLFEEIIRARIAEHTHLDMSPKLHIEHVVADPTRQLDPIPRHAIELQTKSLLLDTPRIGGVVGIGMQSIMAEDSVRLIVIDSILTTMLNVVGSVKAISRYTKDLEYYATRDPLTDLFNQRVFWELLEYEIMRAGRHGYHFAVVVIDLDNFKTVNDLHGHEFGDRYLQALAVEMHQALRQGDLMARYGGDEFTLILPETGEEQAYLVAQRLLQHVERMSLVAPDGSTVKATTSIGVAVFPDHGNDARDLFMVADNMMYKAKHEGKNAICIASADDMVGLFREMGEKSQLVMNALAEGCIVPFFQPICDARNSRIVIHELLMRIEADGRIIPAGEFIEVAESLGIAHKMDYMLIERAFAAVKAQGYGGMLFINLSPKALIVGEFISRIQKLAQDAGIDPQRIVFEITERETVRNITLLEKFVMALKLEGFKFAIDDFGSGFSSFQYVKRFPIDYIKIEGEFIRNMLKDDKDRALVQSIIALARGLGVKTIAEYVEDLEILDAARREGIDFAQGYFIGKPHPQLLPVGSTAAHMQQEIASDAIA
ncbi:EAL domain-containing protein [Aromatoleum petrolei]|uniref:EAL domain-containing protein n=1 Tax=Aromatoleum petrolei TaxID=76116 RepID=A0ABX1MJP9_9RHOO|nr:EAL domain-containing protein [Aromatoleum petrolei]